MLNLDVELNKKPVQSITKDGMFCADNDSKGRRTPWESKMAQ